MKLELKDVCKSFSGKEILHNVNFSIESGRAMGFLGRNGAGKTTTIRTLMNVFKPDSGEILLDGKKFKRSDYKIGYLPEERGLYGKIPILTQLTYLGELKGMNKSDAKESAKNLLKEVELEGYMKQNLDTLSKGNQQKVQILQAIIDDPDIVILDEPFSGLDPVNASVLKNIIRNLIAKGKLVIFSSHQMSYVEEFCDDITFIKDGQIILSDNLKDLQNRYGNGRYRINISGLDEDVDQILKQAGATNVEFDEKSNIVTLTSTDSSNFLRNILDKGFVVESFSDYIPSLEDIFIKLDEEVNSRKGANV
ncbi:ATP-binding cassette domain-containing protein [Lagierella sp.]|uniref:ABC transporter ATP-binding protein n=1 Tax=Lagierella sp. TaxID=2849657 RepID=UPI00260697CD|nr:ATP-binding cassette domain-containing protein [Lagierella sp.]